MCDTDHSDGIRPPTRRDVIRTGISAALLAALPRPLRSDWPAAGVEPESRYLDAAVAAGKWIRATALDAPGGKTWPAVPPDAKTAQRDLYSGSPGVVLFLLELYHATRETAWLDLATAGADH